MAPFLFPLRLGFGCSGAWGLRLFDERAARAVILAAFEGGVRHFDTAPFYGGGEAERRLGAALGAFADPVFVSTKTGTRYGQRRVRKDFSEAAIRGDVEASLKRLGRERLDLLYLHGPSSADLARSLPVLQALTTEGKIGRWGVCGEGAGLEEAVDAGAAVIMGVYNVMRREHAAVFRRARQKGVGVVAVAPLAQGLYRRGFFTPKSGADLWRIARALVKNRSELARARVIRPRLEGIEGWTPGQLALAFTLANPNIDIAITTTTDLGRLQEALGATDRPPPAAALAALAPGEP